MPARPPFATKARVGALDEVNVMRTPSLMCDLGAQVDQLARSPRSKLAILRRDRAISPRVRASGCASSTRTQARCRFKRRARFFSMASRMSSAGQNLADRALFLNSTHLRPSRTPERQFWRAFDRAASDFRIVARGRLAWAAQPAGGHGMRNGMSLAEEPSDFAAGCVVRRHSCGY